MTDLACPIYIGTHELFYDYPPPPFFSYLNLFECDCNYSAEEREKRTDAQNMLKWYEWESEMSFEKWRGS